ncbi:hypothetical protein SAMN05192549_10543 [Duganella sacchari]|uniref:Uncharacterized protein n=1 Tax=Duganella sacchari TaxID=551987 RepID=A0A1M7PG86_9BURK|nr:hypothetical protein [Duganella sacchari]SHN16069.1 hypothetical protein SAMN05192549_10543 [Duganella sacchari]
MPDRYLNVPIGYMVPEEATFAMVVIDMSKSDAVYNAVQTSAQMKKARFDGPGF